MRDGVRFESVWRICRCVCMIHNLLASEEKTTSWAKRRWLRCICVEKLLMSIFPFIYSLSSILRQRFSLRAFYNVDSLIRALVNVTYDYTISLWRVIMFALQFPISFLLCACIHAWECYCVQVHYDNALTAVRNSYFFTSVLAARCKLISELKLTWSFFNGQQKLFCSMSDWNNCTANTRSFD